MGQDTLSVRTLRLKEIVNRGGRGVLVSALATNATVRADFDTRVKYLRIIPRDQWTKKQFRHLKKQIYEIKWTSSKVEWRALGFYVGDHFVVVRCCTHKDQVYDPHDCLERAIQLKAEVQAGSWETRHYEP